jgi:NUMOD4 motif
VPESWLPIPGYEDAYEASDRGRARELIGQIVRGEIWQRYTRTRTRPSQPAALAA